MICPHCGHEIPPVDYVEPSQTMPQHTIYFPIDTTCAAPPPINPIYQDFRINLNGAAQPGVVNYIKLV